MVIDALVTSIYRNIILRHVANIMGYAAKQVEDMKFLVVNFSMQPISTIHGGPHTLVPFVIEDGGILGAHAHALLKELVTSALAKGRTPPVARGSLDTPHPLLVSLQVKRWQKLISSWLHIALSCMTTRLLCLATA